MINIPVSKVPMGTIVAFVLNKKNKPPGWLICDGSPIPDIYMELIDALGSTHTPNLAGRTLIGSGIPNMGVQSDGRNPNFGPSVDLSLGDTGGEYQHTLELNEIPPHNHLINGGAFGTLGTALETGDSGYIPFCSKGFFDINGTDNAGGGQAHFNMQPYYTVHYIIYTGQDN